ncbi:hypothetical protein RN001_014044 [Aquatica leii]|uniref:Bee-milk protein n=1 Tax=Aquatica leii TaxID=1421715 RepID=A0AAN7PRC3_9COLE|nr:hypothetical protein RN001_014044 [Aquatica leii]
MAVSQAWFQNWQPPTSLLTESQPHHVQFFDNQLKKPLSQGRSTNVLSILPYVLSMGIAVPDTNIKTPYEQTQTQNVLERTGPFKTHYFWKSVDFQFPADYLRESAILSGQYVQENNLPLGIETHQNRIFVSFPKWKDGIPCTLATLPKVSNEASPLFVPYPSWEWHNSDSCDSLVSVYRMQVDDCNRLWVLDSGQINVSVKPEQVCPPKIVVFDLNTDKAILRYALPDEFIKQDSLYSNIAVDVHQNQEDACANAYAYIADVWRFGLVVYSLKENRSWRVTDHLFYPDPLASAYKLHGLDFEWTDGIFSLALSPVIGDSQDRYLYFHPMSSFREFYMKTSIIKNETAWLDSKRTIKLLGESRGKNGHASSSAMNKNGIMFFNLVSRDAVGCWDSRKPYKRSNLGILAQSNISLIFPNDLRLDKERRQSVWVISNRLPFFLYSELDKNDYNFRIMSAYVDEAISGTICDPNYADDDTFDVIKNGNDY